MSRKWSRLNETCEYHGNPTKRADCRRCNAAYMRGYLRRRRVQSPELAIWQRAHKRATTRSLTFAISVQSITIPDTCPALGIPIIVGGKRSSNSPSLDRIIPAAGYVPGNIRVISDKANRLKGDQTLAQLEARVARKDLRFEKEYPLIAAYVRRELAGELERQLHEAGLSTEKMLQVVNLAKSLSYRSSECLQSHAHDPDDAEQHLTPRSLEEEYGLPRRRVLLLRRRANFPEPLRKGNGFIFRRADVENWIVHHSHTAIARKLLGQQWRVIRGSPPLREEGQLQRRALGNPRLG